MRNRTLSKLWAIGSFSLAFTVSALVVLLSAEYVLWASGATRMAMGLDFVRILKQWSRGIAEDVRHERVAFIGDSMLMAPAGQKPLPLFTQEALRKRRGRGRHVKLHTLTFAGWGPAAQYFAADEIVGAEPDQIVLELNLRSLGPTPLGPFGFPELAGWIRTERLVEAAQLPLYHAGLTLNRLLFYKLLVKSGLSDTWTALQDRQARLYHVREPAEKWIETVTGTTSYTERQLAVTFGLMAKLLHPGADRERREVSEKTYGNALRGIPEDHDRLRVLRALVDRFRAAQVPVLVWVTPVNVDHLRSVGIDVSGLSRTIETLRRVVTSSGAAFVDLHSILPNRAFRDSGDHFKLKGKDNAGRMLGKLLSDAILKNAGQGPPSGASRARAQQDAVQ